MFLFLISLLFIVTTRVLLRLLTTQFFMNAPSTSRSIVILLVITSSISPLLCLLFPSSLQITDFFTKSHSISRFRFLVSWHIMDLRGDVKKYIIILFCCPSTQHLACNELTWPSSLFVLVAPLSRQKRGSPKGIC